MAPDPNIYFIIILVAVTGLFLLDLVSNLLNLKALDPRLPGEFADIFDEQAYAKSQEYTRATTRFGFLESSSSLLVFLLFWFLGGYEWLDSLVRAWALGPVATGVIFVGILYLAHHLLFLPFEIYDTFVIEEKFGFNKTTPGIFLVDQLKELILSAVIGIPLFALLLFLFGAFELAWLYGWIAVSASSLLLTYLAPRFILPLFNKFEPLDDGELKDAIHVMSEKCRFPLKEITVMDGSKRSSKSNAFFTGFGRNKKIALFDTMIEGQTPAELVAVLAHEIGHFKKKHIVQHMAFSILQTGVLFYLLSLFLNNAQLFAAFGVSRGSVYLSFVFFAILFKPIMKVLSIILSVWSRKNEYEADAFAADATGDTGNLISALKKLSKDNLANLTPHPFYVFILYSHPPMLERIAALKKLRPASS